MKPCKNLIILLLAAVAAVTPTAADTLSGYASRSDITARMEQLPLVPVEGIWLFPASGLTVVIERDDTDAMRFRLVAAMTSFSGIKHGTVIGYMTPTAKSGVFDATLAGVRSDGSVRTIPAADAAARRFTLTLSGDRLSFTPVRKGVKVNWWRMLPYMFRYSVRAFDDRQQGLDGCLRLWPRDPSVPPYQPRYL